MRLIKRIMIAIASIAALLAVSVFIVLRFPQFGQKPTGQHLRVISQSPQHNGKRFENEGGIDVDMSFTKIVSILKAYMNKVEGKRPTALEINKTDLENILEAPDSITALTWFGHSAFLLEMDGKIILLDPMLGPAAAPFSFQVKRFSQDLSIEIEDMPKIDAVIFSHDHYDHLDYHTISAIKDKVGRFYVPLGLSSHLIKWGVQSEKIIEMDWWQESDFEGIQLTCTPSQHFSGRGLNDKGSTLWSSWAIKGKKHNIYFSGDSGYFPGFKAIGEKYGPFDIALIECGQYNELWKEIHMMPEESAQAAIDLHAASIMPIHWGMFELALHPWKEPVDRLAAKAAELSLPLITPEIGERFVLNHKQSLDHWWKDVE